MRYSITDSDLANLVHAAESANREFADGYPGDFTGRQPVHTFYIGAHRFNEETVEQSGRQALRLLKEYAPSASEFGRALGFDSLDVATYGKVCSKLAQQPIEDLRLDFEDGLIACSDAEEDEWALKTAAMLAAIYEAGNAPPFTGIRVKALDRFARRSLRTADIFVTELCARLDSNPSPNFVLTLPKVSSVEQVTVFIKALELLEEKLSLKVGALKVELMVELPQALFTQAGLLRVRALVDAANGRCRGVPLGVYDYTAACGILAPYQSPINQSCDFAKHLLQVALAGSGVTLSDGGTNILPVPPHKDAKPGTPRHTANTKQVFDAWRLHFKHIRHSLHYGYYQGWDVDPGQLPVRYAAYFNTYIGGYAAALARLDGYFGKSRNGAVSDEPATVRALLLFMLRGFYCGALTRAELEQIGTDLKTLQTLDLAAISKSWRPENLPIQ